MQLNNQLKSFRSIQSKGLIKTLIKMSTSRKYRSSAHPYIISEIFQQNFTNLKIQKEHLTRFVDD